MLIQASLHFATPQDQVVNDLLWVTPKGRTGSVFWVPYSLCPLVEYQLCARHLLGFGE